MVAAAYPARPRQSQPAAQDRGLVVGKSLPERIEQ
jgi:hypothetical protein